MVKKDRDLMLKIAKQLKDMQKSIKSIKTMEKDIADLKAGTTTPPAPQLLPGHYVTNINVDFFATVEKTESDVIVKALDTSIREIMKQTGIKRLRCDITTA